MTIFCTCMIGPNDPDPACPECRGSGDPAKPLCTLGYHHKGLDGNCNLCGATPEDVDQQARALERTGVKMDVKAAIADRAKEIVNGARRSAYGAPENNFERIARFWQAYFENTGRGDVKITARDISPLMRLMKEARLAETPDHLDSFVDLVGYALTGAEVNGVKTPISFD